VKVYFFACRAGWVAKCLVSCHVKTFKEKELLLFCAIKFLSHALRIDMKGEREREIERVSISTCESVLIPHHHHVRMFEIVFGWWWF
jgi:hypothetical protein